jgi:hypothetical protein
MVGLMHKLLLKMVESEAGKDAVAEVYRRAGLAADHVFRMNENYDDAEWRRLLEVAFEVLEMPTERAVDLLADYFLTDALDRWPMWFEISKNSREFLKRQPAIHNGFYTGIRDPEMRSKLRDKFHVEERDGAIVTRYRSPNQLCGLYVALARWVIQHYGDTATVEHVTCTQQGFPDCQIHIRWSALRTDESPRSK